MAQTDLIALILKEFRAEIGNNIGIFFFINKSYSQSVKSDGIPIHILDHKLSLILYDNFS